MSHNRAAVEAQTQTPAISVVVASHDRALRLRWLLNALERQTLPRDQWEVIVGHDSQGPDTERLLRTHPLARDGVLRHAQLPPGSAPPGANRNAALPLVRAPLIAFTDDDCRPPEDWLENALAAARRHPGCIVQGRTMKDPLEAAMQHAAHYHSQRIVPPTPWAECCNIVYPREFVEAVGGFDEHQYTGEDTDLKVRCQKAGAGYVGAPEVLTYHSVNEVSFLRHLRGRFRWTDLPYLLKKHPDFRANFPMWIFWKRTHVWLPFFLAGLWLAGRKHAVYAILCMPYTVHAMGTRGTDPRSRFRDLSEFPTHVAFELAEMLALARGSLKYRTLLL